MIKVKMLKIHRQKERDSRLIGRIEYVAEEKEMKTLL